VKISGHPWPRFATIVAHSALMNTKTLTATLTAAFSLAAFASGGCDRKTRSNPADEQHRAATPAEGGNTLTQGSAGDRKNFGDTRATTQVDGKSPSASPTGMSKDTTPARQTQTPAAGSSTEPTPTPPK